MEENYAFDAEVYADETDFKDTVDFRDDQRINLGKWILRYLFASLIDEEIRRDEEYRARLKTTMPHLTLPSQGAFANGGLNGHANGWGEDSRTPRPTHGSYPMTPGLAIGVATPGAGLAPPLPGTAGDESKPRISGDYFSSNPPPAAAAPTDTKASESGSDAAPENPTSPTEPEKDAKSSRFGKKFRMTFPKKFGRASADQSKPAATDEKAEESDKSSEKGDKIVEDNFYGVVQKIRNEYDDKLASDASKFPETGITPSMPIETPVLKPLPSTAILIHEDSTDVGGVADVYRGTVKSLAHNASEIEKAAPMWLGDLLLRNQLPFKDLVKLSFVLLPWDDRLPSIAGSDGNARLNANRMLRAKKVLGYVMERIDPDSKPPEETAAAAGGGGGQSADDQQQQQQQHDDAKQDQEGSSAIRPEDYLELYCQDQLIPPNMTLVMIKMHVWKSSSDVVLYYKSNGRKPELEENWAAEKARKEKEEAEAAAAAGAAGATTDGATAAT